MFPKFGAVCPERAEDESIVWMDSKARTASERNSNQNKEQEEQSRAKWNRTKRQQRHRNKEKAPRIRQREKYFQPTAARGAEGTSSTGYKCKHKHLQSQHGWQPVLAAKSPKRQEPPLVTVQLDNGSFS